MISFRNSLQKQLDVVCSATLESHSDQPTTYNVVAKLQRYQAQADPVVQLESRGENALIISINLLAAIEGRR